MAANLVLFSLHFFLSVLFPPPPSHFLSFPCSSRFAFLFPLYYFPLSLSLSTYIFFHFVHFPISSSSLFVIPLIYNFLSLLSIPWFFILVTPFFTLQSIHFPPFSFVSSFLPSLNCSSHSIALCLPPLIHLYTLSVHFFPSPLPFNPV